MRLLFFLHFWEYVISSIDIFCIIFYSIRLRNYIRYGFKTTVRRGEPLFWGTFWTFFLDIFWQRRRMGMIFCSLCSPLPGDHFTYPHHGLMMPRKFSTALWTSKSRPKKHFLSKMCQNPFTIVKGIWHILDKKCCFWLTFWTSKFCRKFSRHHETLM